MAVESGQRTIEKAANTGEGVRRFSLSGDNLRVV